MQRRSMLVTGALAAMAVALVSFSGCTSILGDFEVVQNTPPEAGSGGNADGTACTAPTECKSGQCVDGVCCESACNGECETCNLPSTAGKCMPIPDGEDPQNECPTEPRPDAGTPDSGIVFEDAGDGGDAGDLDAGDAGDAGDGGDGGLAFVTPDGGVTTQDNQCAGKCNGKRACAYPGKERTCGSVICGNTEQQGRASCDGAGHCLFGIEQCEAYSCPDGKPGCVKTCGGESDCLATHFCDAATSSCKPKLANGSACGSVTNCQSGFCVGNVCCNSECNGFPGATCTKPGFVGSCQCNACAAGTCQLWYRDEDGDGFGDKYGTLANGRAVPGCVGGPAPPGGYVDNKDDCYDGPGNTALAAQVRPNQTGYYPAGALTAYTAPGQAPSFDFNCDGLIEKETPEFVNGTCGFCRHNLAGDVVGCSKTATSCTNNESAGLGCGSFFCFPRPCASCPTITTTGFTTTVECGDTKTVTDCGYCSNNAVVGTTFAQRQQRCR